MFNRRSLVLSLLALPLPLATAIAQPWWNENDQRARWEQYEREEKRRREARHESWDEVREHEEWERHEREVAQRDWERDHGHHRP